MLSPDTKEDVLSNNFEKIFKTMMFAMKMIRFQPYMKKDIKWALQFGTMYGITFMIFCLLIYSMIFHDLRTNDIAQACSNGILSIIFGVLTFQYCVVFYYNKIIEEMIEKMNDDYFNAKKFPKDEQQCVREHIEKGKFVITIWFIISISGASLFILKAMSLMVYYTIFDEFKYVHIYDLTYPDSVEAIKNTLGPYCIINVVFAFYDIYVMFMFIGFAPMGPIFLLHACGQLEIAKTRVMKIFHQDNTMNDIEKKLKDVAKLLVEIYRFISKINVGFMVLYELTLKTTTIVLPITFYQIIEASKSGEIRVEFLCVIVGGITMSSVPCYYSDKLMESGENLRRAIYMCGWEKRWDQKSRTLILLLLLRTTPSVTIRTMFCPVCLDTLADVFHQAYAIFSVLNAACN